MHLLYCGFVYITPDFHKGFYSRLESQYIKRKVQHFCIYILFSKMHYLLTINISHWSGTFVPIEPTLSHLCYPKFIICITVLHSWYYTFYEFKKMYNDMYPSLYYHTEYFHCSKEHLCFDSNSEKTGLFFPVF